MKTRTPRATTAPRRAALAALLALTTLTPAPPAAKSRPAAPVPAQSATARARELAARFAPVFRQGLGDERRFDYITNFDFDGDWRGDNNWRNAADTRFPLRAHVYYAVSETETHYFVHYAVFHPRDYKGGAGRGTLLSEAIREGVRRGGKYDPTGLSAGAVLAHENDMEGCLVVATKDGAGPERARLAFVETLAHDRFLKYVAEGGEAVGFERVRAEGDSPVLYVEPKGHGVYAYVGGKGQEPRGGALVYRFAGRAEDPEAAGGESVGYELLPLRTTLWPRALKGAGETFGAAHAYAALTVSARRGASKAASRRVGARRLGSAFAGKVGAAHAARPPWGWFDRTERGRPAGEWFFDPAAVVKRHFNQPATFSLTYLDAPFLGVVRP